MIRRKPLCRRSSVRRLKERDFLISVTLWETSRITMLTKFNSTMMPLSWKMKKTKTTKTKNSMLMRRLWRKMRGNRMIRSTIKLKNNKTPLHLIIKYLQKKSTHIGFRINSPSITTHPKFSVWRSKSWKSYRKKQSFRLKTVFFRYLIMRNTILSRCSCWTNKRFTISPDTIKPKIPNKERHSRNKWSSRTSLLIQDKPNLERRIKINQPTIK